MVLVIVNIISVQWTGIIPAADCCAEGGLPALRQLYTKKGYSSAMTFAGVVVKRSVLLFTYDSTWCCWWYT